MKKRVATKERKVSVDAPRRGFFKKLFQCITRSEDESLSNVALEPARTYDFFGSEDEVEMESRQPPTVLRC